jgi:hypothetical protein
MTPRWPILAACLIGCGADDASVPLRAAEPAREPPVAVKDEPAIPPRLEPCDGSRAALRTLIVGNSQIYFWDLPRLISDLSATAPSGCARIAAEGFTNGGQNLERFWKGGDSLGHDLETVIREGRYDVVEPAGSGADAQKELCVTF